MAKLEKLKEALAKDPSARARRPGMEERGESIGFIASYGDWLYEKDIKETDAKGRVWHEHDVRHVAITDIDDHGKSDWALVPKPKKAEPEGE